MPRRYDPLAGVLTMESVNSQMQRLKMLIRQTAKAMRKILSAAATKLHKKSLLQIIE